MRSGYTITLEAQQLISIGRASDAIPLLNQAIAADPQSSKPRCLLSLAYFKLDQYEEALAAATDAVVIAPQSEWAHRLRAINLKRLKRGREALEAAREAARLGPEMPEALQLLAICLADERKLQEARETAAALIRLAPDNALSHHTAGLIAVKERKWQEAERHYRRALEIDPEDSDSMNNLGLALRRQGKKKEAIERFHDAARLNPSAEVPRKNLREAVGAYASISFGLIYVFARVVRALVNSTSPQYRTAAICIGVLVFASGVAVYAFTRRKRMSELHANVQQFYQVETRQIRRKSRGRIGIGVLVSITALTLLICTFPVADNLISGFGINVPLLVLYGLLWCVMIAEIVWLIRNW